MRVRLTEAERILLRELATHEQRSVSDVVRTAIVQYVARDGLRKAAR
jgi:hypothetical protein